MILALLIQAAAPNAASPPPERFSVLAPNCPQSEADDDDIVVCARGLDSPFLPLPAERGPPDRPRPSNPEMRGTETLAQMATPCSARQGGCQVGFNIFGPPVMLVRLLTKAVNPNNDCCEGNEATDPVALVRDGVRGVKTMMRKKPDTSNRIPIPLEDDPIPPLRP